VPCIVFQSSVSIHNPDLVEFCVKKEESRGLDVTGLYSIPGSSSAVSALVQKIKGYTNSFSIKVLLL
jgi:hypothetical protein